ncbi:MAG: hypothetical protein AABX70_00305 [Nanoarchaeota archaeon]
MATLQLVHSGHGLIYPYRKVVLYESNPSSTQAGAGEIKAIITHQGVEEISPTTVPLKESVLTVAYWGQLDPAGFVVLPSGQGRTSLENRVFLIGEHVARQPLNNLRIPPMFTRDDISGMLSTSLIARVDVYWTQGGAEQVLYETRTMDSDTRRSRLRSLAQDPECLAGSSLISVL